jgi:uncharacterized protein YjiS (DUF1127 family)
MAGVPEIPLLGSERRAYISVVLEGRHQMSIRQKFARYAAYRQTIRELSKLDDRELRDVGLTRGDILSIARGAAL